MTDARQAAMLGGLETLPQTFALRDATSTEGRWWHRPFGMFQTNLRENDAGLDVERVLDYIQAHGATTWLVNAGGILSWYPTDLPFQTRNPFLARRQSGDLLGDAVNAAHRRGVRLMARMDFSKVAPRIAAEHPEWCYVSPRGLPQEYSGLVSVCPSAGYYREKTFHILDEVIARYPVDGFFFNWFGFNEVDYSKVYHGVCQCVSCHQRFRQHSGLGELPTGPESPNYAQWLVFTRDTIHALTSRLRAHIASRRPEACLLGRTGDIIFHEANNALGRELWHHATSQAVSVAKSYRPDVPVLVNAVTFVDMPYRMAGEQPEHFAQYFAQTISRGGNPSTYIMGTPGQIPYPCLDIAGQITRFHKRWHDIYDGMRPAAKTGLVQPDRLAQSADHHRNAISEFRGLYSALQQRHIPFDVVAQERLADMEHNASLSRYALLVLPDLGPLTGSQIATLDAFVASGGRLLATGSTALGQLESLPVERELAVTDTPQLLWSTYVAPEQLRDSGDAAPYTGPIAPVYGAYHFCAWKPDAERRHAMLARANYGPPEKAYGNLPVDHPGFAISSYGDGRAAIVPWTIGRAYHDLGVSALRDLVEDIARELLGGEEAVSADLPEQVELTVHNSGPRTVVHLINFSGARRSNFGPVVPISGGRLRINGLSANATGRALVKDEVCVIEHIDRKLVIQVPELELFEVIVIEDSK